MYTQGVFLLRETKGEDAVVRSKGNRFDVTCFYLLMNVCSVSLVKTLRGKLSFSETCADSSTYPEWVLRVQKFSSPLLETQS